MGPRFRIVLSCLALAVAALAIGPPREAMPPFRARSMDGQAFTNDSLKGKFVLVQFWATWCGYCRRDEPAVEEIVRDYSARGLIVLAVNVGESKKKVVNYLAGSPRTARIVLMEDTNLAAMVGARAYPMYLVLDRDGKVAGVQKGSGGGEALRQLLAEAGLK